MPMPETMTATTKDTDRVASPYWSRIRFMFR
jgi:hypothetical protein